VNVKGFRRLRTKITWCNITKTYMLHRVLICFAMLCAVHFFLRSSLCCILVSLLPVCLGMPLSVCTHLPVILSFCLSICLSLSSSIYLSVSVLMSVYMYLYLCLCVLVHLAPAFLPHQPPTSIYIYFSCSHLVLLLLSFLSLSSLLPLSTVLLVSINIAYGEVVVNKDPQNELHRGPHL
jgi:hypothetical protein